MVRETLGDNARLRESFSQAEIDCASVAVGLGALQIGGQLSRRERTLALLALESPATEPTLVRIREAILDGDDPFADILSSARSIGERRRRGAFYTSGAMSDAMVNWLLEHDLERVVDVGSGTGRFAASIARADRSIEIVAVDIDPVASLACRAALKVVGASGVIVQNCDYRCLSLSAPQGRTGYIGNPPYVRQQELPHWSRVWGTVAAGKFGHSAAGAGLHVHFYLATALRGKKGDVGCFLTSAEWLDTRYGSILRDLHSNKLGGISVDLFDPRTEPFPSVLTTAVITCFEIGARTEHVKVQRFQKTAIDCLGGGCPVPVTSLQLERRWSPLIRSTRVGTMDIASTVRLGEVARVHRGVATGANQFFVMSSKESRRLNLSSWCRPVLNRGAAIRPGQDYVRAAEEGPVILIVPPNIRRRLHPALDEYLKLGEPTDGDASPISKRYLARTRRPWWSINPGRIPPILATYMSRNPPRFALNPDGLIPLNVAHGVYPIVALEDHELLALVRLLNSLGESFRGGGRTYFGGLEKFEPSDMLALPISVDGDYHNVITKLREARNAKLTS